MIDRELLFGNPEISNVRISPDGRHISYLAPFNGVMNVWIAPADNPKDARVVTNDTLRGIRIYLWSFKEDVILYMQDQGGDENWNVFMTNASSGETVNLTPFDQIPGPDGQPVKLPNGNIMRPRADILNVSDKTPNEIAIKINKDNPENMDVYVVNLETREIKKIVEDEAFMQVLVNDQNQPVIAMKTIPEGGAQVFKYVNQEWEKFFVAPREDLLTFGFVGLNKENDKVYLIDSRDRNTAALYAMHLGSGEKELIGQDKKSDIQGALIHPTEKTIQAVASNFTTTEWKVLDKEIRDDLDYLKGLQEGELSVNSRSHDDKIWIVGYNVPDGSYKYYKYEKDQKKAEFLFSNQPKLDEYVMARMYPHVVKSRDNMDVVTYLTIPRDKDKNGKTIEPLPMVLLVHGGPWARDYFGFNPMHQWLANRGYAVISVNYRGSSGYGKDYINAAIHEWAGKMHDDLIDAVDWAIDRGIADSSRVAIMGGSYGGYATLVGLTFTPDKFACGIDIVGPSNLNTLLSTIPPYWKAIRDVFVMHVGDPDTEEGRELLEERSPLNRVDQIKKPLLIGQGANDPRVKQTESDQIVKAMQEKNIPVTYVLYSDEGHGFARPENRLSFYAVSEQFLKQHLGGSAQEVGDDFENSTIQVIAGAEFIEGLPAREEAPADTVAM